MGPVLLVWLLSTVALVAAVYMAKSVRWGKPATLNAFHWPGLIVIALIAGAVPAFFYQYQSSRSVAVPDGVAERPSIPGDAKN